MFTGYIKETGIIKQVNSIESGAELIIQISPQFAAEIAIKSHIAIDGSWNLDYLLNKKST